MPKSEQPEPKSDDALECALSRWENEGGALQTEETDEYSRPSGLAHEEEEILRRLGAGVVARWMDLPKRIQTELFRSTTSADCELNAKQLKRQIARFLHLYAQGNQRLD